MIYLALAIALFFAVPMGLECLFACLMDDAEKESHLQESFKEKTMKNKLVPGITLLEKESHHE